MYTYLALYNILLITFIQGNIIPALKNPKQTSVDNELSKAVENKTNKAVSEGGIIVSSNPVTLSIENESLPKNIDKELSVSENNKGKSIVPRKGVVYNPVENVNAHDKIDQSSAITISNNTTNTTVELSTSIKGLNESNTLNSTQKLNITQNHKPLSLSYEALAKIDEVNHLKLDENGPNIKIHSGKAGGHPEIIMPIVITILVVPMFAVLSYMAIKRGQEAWKNRHYKRMDFLLDGMYND
ncbi:unnamed protein product [Euphydryas editha]|uniref:24 kDa salivary protein n=1 Tax=Euphydryas editha TaxID=104508 RepID=A0AAU9TXD4_EUPED|nr:unnamed protein product [Euphydryas editha]